MTSPSIASLFNLCIRSFDLLCDLLQQSPTEFSSQLTQLMVQDEIGRFRVWAGNVGAHRKGRLSLDHKLREASKIHEKVAELLLELNSELQEVISIVSHQREPGIELVWSSGSESSVSDGLTEPEDEIDFPVTTELQERFFQVIHIITCLYRFSIVIRNPTENDRLQRSAKIDVSHYEFFDLQHASQKFSGAPKYITDRLGMANTRRRQLLKYHAKHHDKITRFIDVLEPLKVVAQIPDLPVDVDGGKESVQDLLSAPLEESGTVVGTLYTETVVSTVLPNAADTNTEVSSDDGQSQTSYATSIGNDSYKLQVPSPPRLPDVLDGNPFECPYCFTIVEMYSWKSWMKHVFRDLRPYVCTFNDCLKPGRLFDSRHEWYDHEVEVHRREWFCIACQHVFPTKTLFADHLTQTHKDLFTEAQIIATVDICGRAIDSEQLCILCGETFLPARLQRHLAHHMQQLALFALPGPMDDSDDEGGSVGAHASREGSSDESNPRKTDAEINSSTSGERVDGTYTVPEEIPDMDNEAGAEDPEGGDTTRSIVTTDECFANFRKFIDGEKFGLKVFYKDDNAIRELAPFAKTMVETLLSRGCGKEIALQLSLLILYDLALLLDDSSSMESEQDGTRIDTMKRAIREITSVYELANPNGIQSVQYFNDNKWYKDIGSKMLSQLFKQIKFDGITRIGTALRSKTLNTFVWKNLMNKPLLVMMITDGDAEGERRGLLRDVILNCIGKIRSDPERGHHAVAFHFLVVGDDEGAKALAESLDNDIEIGSHVNYLHLDSIMQEVENPDNRWHALPRLLIGGILDQWDIVNEIKEIPNIEAEDDEEIDFGDGEEIDFGSDDSDDDDE